MLDVETSHSRTNSRQRTRKHRKTTESRTQGGEITDWETQEHAEDVIHGEREEVSLLDLADPGQPYNRERAEAQKDALEKTAKVDSQSLDEIDDLL